MIHIDQSKNCHIGGTMEELLNDFINFARVLYTSIAEDTDEAMAKAVMETCFEMAISEKQDKIFRITVPKRKN